MSYVTGHNSFTSNYFLNILQIMYVKCVKKNTFTKIGIISYFHRDGRKTDSSKLTLTKWFHKNPKIKL